MDENKMRHLEFIQNVISRMAQNSFLLKGWTVTLVSALFIFANTKDIDNSYLIVAYIPIFFFWILDSYFLHEEKLFRKMYDSVRIKLEKDIDFEMNPSIFKGEVDSWLEVVVSKTLILFYLPIFGVILIALFYL
ncbi:hypothetical protein [Planomicrobium okeanokoites]|uniref:hypothetical protein n=1 Tax=Planomicrobium okeanokoites TaxID=244 RepID=UPI00248FAB8C|nr:hypothetical protein [Planomicrobium okeanokoites]